MNRQTLFSVLGFTLLLTACGGSILDDSITTGVSTNSILCGVDKSGTQSLTYQHSQPGGSASDIDENLSFNYRWSCDDHRLLTGNGVPNHAVTNGSFATKISAQSISVNFPLTPAKSSTSVPQQVPGFALNSIKMEPGTAGACPDYSTSESECNYAMSADTWRMEALSGTVSPWLFDFGVDNNNAHVQPNGQYHYHGMPEDLMKNINSSSTTKMILVGWAKDGFPIYARYGYSIADDSTSTLKIITTSYRIKATPDSESRPFVEDFPMGHFTQDWEYVEGLGDLDECNGRTGVTPEFPDGIYHYYITEGYPYIQRCINGVIN